MQRDNSPQPRRRTNARRGRPQRAWWNSDFYFISVGHSTKTLDQVLESLKGKYRATRIAYCTEQGEELRKVHWHFVLYYSGNVMVLREDMVELFGSNDINIKTPPYYDRFKIENYVGKDQTESRPLVWQLGKTGWEHQDFGKPDTQIDTISAEDVSEGAE